MSIQEQIYNFLHEKNPQAELTYETELFKSGVVNSLFALEIVIFVETTFGIRLKRKDVKLENFESINRIAALVERVQKGK